MSDARLRSLQRSLAFDSEAEVHYRHTLRRSSDPGQSELQRAAFLSCDPKALRQLCRETPGAEQLRPDQLHLAAFLGHPAASRAFGVEACPPPELEGWVGCLFRWGGDETLLHAGVAIGREWPPPTPGGRSLLRRGESYAARPGFLRGVRLRRAFTKETGIRTAGAFVRFYECESFLRWALEIARERGAADPELREATIRALRDWVAPKFEGWEP